MKKISLLVSVFLTLLFLKDAQSSSPRILVFAGAASKPATEETVKTFHERFGIPVDVVFGGSGFVLSQMKLGKRAISTFQGLPTLWR